MPPGNVDDRPQVTGGPGRRCVESAVRARPLEQPVIDEDACLAIDARPFGDLHEPISAEAHVACPGGGMLASHVVCVLRERAPENHVEDAGRHRKHAGRRHHHREEQAPAHSFGPRQVHGRAMR